jgi:hypothetical protein
MPLGFATMFRHSLLLLFALFSPFGATAATVVSFDATSGYNTNFQKDDQETLASGTWNESGFQVDWTYTEPWGMEADTTAFAFLSDCYFGGCFGTGTSMTFRRMDGGSFSLKSFDVPSLSVGWSSHATFTPYAADGSLDYTNVVDQALNTRFNNVVFYGIKSSGRVFTANVSAFDAAKIVWDGGQSSLNGDGTFVVSGRLSRLLSNLKSLRVSVGAGNLYSYDGTEMLVGNQTWEDFLQDFFLQSLNATEIDPIFKQIPKGCVGICSVPGLGEFYLSELYASSSNWGTAVEFDNFRLSTAEPAPIPIPAGGLLLIGGLVSLLGFRRPANLRRRTT